jgi:Zn-dependent protease
MPTSNAITLFRVRGIRIGVDYSWFFILFLLILWLSDSYKNDASGRATDTAYVLAVVSALAFFVSILLHELGHAFVARRKGIGISEITLWMFGGVARMDRDSDSPGTEFQVAAAGPLVTLVIAAACILGGFALEGSDDFNQALLHNNSAGVSGVGAVLAYLGFINVIVLVFNLIPAFPLDGGRIARSIAWRRTGDRRSATRLAATLGRIFAYLMVGVGIFAFFKGYLITGIWFAVIGFMLNGAARGAVLQEEFTSPIEGLQVSDVMDREPVAMPAEIPVGQALDEYFLRYRWPWFPVVDAAGRFRGLIERGQAEAVPEVEREATIVETLLPRESAAHSDLLSVREDSPLETVLNNQALRNLGALAAVDSDGRLRGVLTADAVGRALREPTAGA